MTISLERLVEQQIEKSLAESKLRGLEGEGKPLPDRSGEAFINMATAVAARIMAEAGVLPEEFKIKKLLEAVKQSFRQAPAPLDAWNWMLCLAVGVAGAQNDPERPRKHGNG